MDHFDFKHWGSDWLTLGSILQQNPERIQTLSLARQDTVNALLGLAYEAAKLACDMDDVALSNGHHSIDSLLDNIDESYAALQTSLPAFLRAEPDFGQPPSRGCTSTSHSLVMAPADDTDITLVTEDIAGPSSKRYGESDAGTMRIP